MSHYSNYKHLLGIRYTPGDQDCYGLALRYYAEVYDLHLLDIARPEGWWDDPEIDLISDFSTEDNWDQVPTNIRTLKPGDGLVFSLLTGRGNHVGIYVGNGLFIHHLYKHISAEDALLPKWTSRLLMVLRHPKVTAFNESKFQKLNLVDTLPDYAKSQFTSSL